MGSSSSRVAVGGSRDYRIAIICALPLERTAVEAMLDERHGQRATPGDDNAYTFGRIGKHFVVVASLGTAIQGAVSTVRLAHEIQQSFPHIKYRLSVGIAGGVARPGEPNGDIRLGDIVVACGHGVPSIVHYGSGKMLPTGFALRTEFSQPPHAILKAVGALQSQHQQYGPTYLVHLQAMLRKNHRLNQHSVRKDFYGKPRTEDLLYSSDSDYNQRLPLPRAPRSLPMPPDGVIDGSLIETRAGCTNYPHVFYGTVASADYVMSSSRSRDEVYRLVKQQTKASILCFETEAAGVSDWQCLVIRGICDYSDSHRTEAWRNFAAATAASYAKDLLHRIPIEAL